MIRAIRREGWGQREPACINCLPLNLSVPCLASQSLNSSYSTFANSKAWGRVPFFHQGKALIPGWRISCFAFYFGGMHILQSFNCLFLCIPYPDLSIAVLNGCCDFNWKSSKKATLETGCHFLQIKHNAFIQIYGTWVMFIHFYEMPLINDSKRIFTLYTYNLHP